MSSQHVQVKPINHTPSPHVQGKQQSNAAKSTNHQCSSQLVPGHAPIKFNANIKPTHVLQVSLIRVSFTRWIGAMIQQCWFPQLLLLQWWALRQQQRQHKRNSRRRRANAVRVKILKRRDQRVSQSQPEPEPVASHSFAITDPEKELNIETSKCCQKTAADFLPWAAVPRLWCSQTPWGGCDWCVLIVSSQVEIVKT